MMALTSGSGSDGSMTRALMPWDHKILYRIRLRRRSGDVFHDNVQAQMLRHQQLRHPFGMKHHARGPPVVGGGNGNANGHFLVLGVSPAD